MKKVRKRTAKERRPGGEKMVNKSSKPVRLGFVGVGTMGQVAHLKNYVTLENCEVVALAEPRPRQAQLVARRYGIAKVYDNHRDMLEAEDLDGVVASQPFDRHAVLLPELHQAVGAVFTEKPLAVSVEAAEKLASGAADSGCAHMVGYHKRCDPATIYARGVIDQWRASGEMGPMQYVRILMPAGDWIAGGFTELLDVGEDRPAGLATEPLPPPGMDEKTGEQYVQFVNYYIHQINLMRYLLNEPYQVAYAEPSGVLLAVESKSGIPGAIEMTPYRTTIDWQESALVAFEKGYVKLRLPAPLASNRPGAVEVYADPGDGVTPRKSIPALEWTHAMRRQAMCFVNVCRGEARPPCGAAEAVEDLRIARDYIRMRLTRITERAGS
jgi:predicted dehydrogenase